MPATLSTTISLNLMRSLEKMSESPALITVEIEAIGEEHFALALGAADPEYATRMADELAAHLNIEPAPEGEVLGLTLPRDEATAAMQWIGKNFPETMGTKLPSRHASLRTAAWSRYQFSKWRLFELKATEDVPDTEEVINIVAAVVDMLDQVAKKWGLDGNIGAMIHDFVPPLRVTVSPDDQTVFVDTDCAAEPPEGLQASPYAGRTVH